MIVSALILTTFKQGFRNMACQIMLINELFRSLSYVCNHDHCMFMMHNNGIEECHCNSQVYVWGNQRLERLHRYVASQMEYLVVKDRNGQVEHVPGYVTVVMCT